MASTPLRTAPTRPVFDDGPLGVSKRSFLHGRTGKQDNWDGRGDSFLPFLPSTRTFVGDFILRNRTSPRLRYGSEITFGADLPIGSEPLARVATPFFFDLETFCAFCCVAIFVNRDDYAAPTK